MIDACYLCCWVYIIKPSQVINQTINRVSSILKSFLIKIEFLLLFSSSRPENNAVSICEKTSKFPKQIKKETKKKIFLLKNVVYLVYLLDKYLKMKIHKILEHQMNVYVPTFIKILLFQPYCKQNIRLKKRNHKHTDTYPRKYCAYRKAYKTFNILIWKFVHNQIL